MRQHNGRVVDLPVACVFVVVFEVEVYYTTIQADMGDMTHITSLQNAIVNE
jgi:hypothetical protein